MIRRTFIVWALNQVAIAWVLIFGALWLTSFALFSGAFGIDSQIYAAAARSWLTGGDPWAVTVVGYRFAGPPTSLLAFAPFAFLPTEVMERLIAVLSLGAVVLAIRWAHVGWWALLWAPVIEGVWVGSLDPVALALLVAPTATTRLDWLAALAPIARLFTIVPLLFQDRRRVVIAAAALLIVTAPFLPWAVYLSRFGELTAVLIEQSGRGKSATAAAWLIPPTVLALIAIGRRDGAWLAVPALWPASQLHYGILAIPVGSPIFAAFAFSPLDAPFAWGAIALALVRAVERRLDPWSWLPDRVTPERWRPTHRSPTTVAAAVR